MFEFQKKLKKNLKSSKIFFENGILYFKIFRKNAKIFEKTFAWLQNISKKTKKSLFGRTQEKNERIFFLKTTEKRTKMLGRLWLNGRSFWLAEVKKAWWGPLFIKFSLKRKWAWIKLFFELLNKVGFFFKDSKLVVPLLF